ncbi:averantin oxidoreductase [Xylariaceae sp. FL1651]|nr:averantin oxidoreductase [Xylariaceae sp. FL1651]
MPTTEIPASVLGLVKSSQSPHIVTFVIFLLFISIIAYYGCVSIYNTWLHPLARYPGPRLAAAGQWWMISSYFNGRTPTDLLKLHNQYGPVVRTAPNELSYINPSQWREIYGYKPQGQAEFAKDHKYFSGLKFDPIILTADRHYHGYIRKLLAHGFSEKSLRDQEPILKQYIDTMCRRLYEESQDGLQSVDILSWYNFLIFDFIGFLAFGESFDCLTNSSFHTWVRIFFSEARSLSYSQMTSRLPYLLQAPFERWFVPQKVRSDRKTLRSLNEEKIKHRLENKPGVIDFMDKLVEAYHSGKMTLKQLEGNAYILTGAGSETTATLLAGLTWLLLKHPRVLGKLTSEIRTAFQSADEINIGRLNNCKYLLACVEEALRIYPPSSQPHHRIVPPNGAVINGEFVPGGTSVGIPIYAACNSPLNWTQPEAFIPERWIADKDSIFFGDKKEAAQPFSYGPRNCIGRNLAYAEIKLVISRMVWHFDMENATEGDWMDQRVYLVWEKSPLWIKLHPAKQAQ